MRKLSIPLFVFFALSACGPATNVLPDGGRERLVCTREVVSITVRVVDAQGNPVEGATVTGTNIGTGKQATGTTNAQGITQAIDESLGGGSVVIRAQKDSKTTGQAQVNFVCGECHCSGEPNYVTLTLS